MAQAIEKPMIMINISSDVLEFLNTNSTVVYIGKRMFIQPAPYWYRATDIVGLFEVTNEDPRKQQDNA
jgi:hypothetical protein